VSLPLSSTACKGFHEKLVLVRSLVTHHGENLINTVLAMIVVSWYLARNHYLGNSPSSTDRSILCLALLYYT
jgi:hypothetical protein